MNYVLFLGAGFSVPHGMPAMDDFIRKAQLSESLNDAHKAQLGELILRARAANAFLASSPTNLEHLLSFAVMADRLDLKGGKELSEEMTKILGRMYSKGLPIGDFQRMHTKLQALISPRSTRETASTKAWSRHKLTVITTNYDINAEIALRLAGFAIDLGFDPIPEDGTHNRYGLDQRTTDDLYEAPTNTQRVGLYKLHGSVNWFDTRDPNAKDRLRVDGRIVTRQEIHGIPSKGGTVVEKQPIVNQPKYWSADSSTPIIVSPSFLKPTIQGPLAKIWQAAARALNEAHTVAFIGYSFPQTDNEMLYLLATSFSSNQNLQSIKVVDPNADEILRRLNAEPSRIGSHFKGLLKEIKERSWEDVTNVFDL